MDLKNQIEQSGEQKQHHRQLSRLSKAAKHAEELVRLASQRCDARSALEAEVYASQMAGIMLLEREVDWEGALAKFLHARKLLEELFKVGSFEQRATCRHFLDQVEPAVRFCEYQIGRLGGKAPDTSQLLEAAAGVGAGSDVLSGKLASLAAEAQAERAAATSEITWDGEIYPIRDDRCRIAVHAARELQTQLDEQLGTLMEGIEGPGSDINPLISLFDRTINAYSEAQSAVRAASQLGSRGEDAELQNDELMSLGRALRGIELQQTIARNIMLAKSAAARYHRALRRQLLGGKASKDRSGERPGKPEDVVRIYETLISNATELNALAGDVGGTAGESLMDECSAYIDDFKAAKTVYAAHGLLLHGDYSGAAALFDRGRERCGQAVKKHSECSEIDVAAVERLKRLEEEATAFKAVALGEMHASSMEKAEETAEQVDELRLQDQTRQRGKDGAMAFLSENWDVWESYAGEGAAKIVPLPPNPRLLPVRPIVLDTAWMCVEAPNVAHRVPKSRKTEGKSDGGLGGATGMVSRLFGWK